jgi:hypothetical protein
MQPPSPHVPADNSEMPQDENALQVGYKEMAYLLLTVIAKYRGGFYVTIRFDRSL